MKYDVERAVITLSVGELCARALQPADLDLRTGVPHFSPDRAAEGREAHKLLQKRAGEGYQAELPLSCTTLLNGIHYEVSGRADGFLPGDISLVEEIKTVGGKAFERAPSLLHEAQAMCYAWFLCVEKSLERIKVRLTLYRTEDGKTRSFERLCEAEELRAYYLHLLSGIEFRAGSLVERQTIRIPSVQSGRFPFSSVREGQDIMIRECYRDIRAGKRLFVQAPTGTGKTVSALYPAVRALGDRYCDKIFYLTAKASTRREAYRAAADIYEAGSHLRTVVLTAREQICANREAIGDPAGVSRHCNPANCPRAAGFYERSRKAIEHLLSVQNGFPRTSIEETAAKFNICPYEFQLELSEFCDIVICDYNYVFDPQVWLRRYFEPDAVAQNQYVFLVDEAHNLADRASDMHSAELRCTHLESAYLALSPDAQTDEKRLKPLEDLIVAMRGMQLLCKDDLTTDENGNEHGYYLNKRQMESFDLLVASCRAFTEKWLYTHPDHPGEREIYALSATLKRYETISQLYDSRFLTFLEVNGKELSVRQICLDPSHVLDIAMNRARASVLFSATLTPPDYFADILGGGKNAVRISLPSPFPRENFCLASAVGVSTRYEDREKSARKIASLIAAAVSGKAGNYIVYFPSYDYMEKVYETFSDRYPTVETVLQERGMSAARKEEFLDAFCEDSRLRVGFCVLGGSFSEGVDLPGKRLIGTVIVGVGLPGISNERNILREYYDVTRERGYDYAYTYPGMNRVLQAAGRVIRRESDRGVIVLIDDRYGSPRYQTLFPEHWTGIQYAKNAFELANIVSDFWLRCKKNQ